MPSLHICLSLGRVKRLEEGLGNFFVGLSRALIAESVAHEPEIKVTWHVHARSHLHGCLGNGVRYHHANRFDRVLNGSPTPFDVWHNLHQLNTLKPGFRSRHVLQTVHDLNFLYDDDAKNARHQLKKVTRLCSQADEIVCISRHTAHDVARHIATARKPSVIYNGVDDLSLVAPVPVVELVGKSFFFHLSRMTPNKNPECLLEVAKLWPSQHFVFAGPSTRESIALRERFSRLSNVSFIGEINDGQKAWLYAHCEAFLFPSLAEGFGLPPLEAMRFGTPAFVSDRTSLPEICPFKELLLKALDAQSVKDQLNAAMAAGMKVRMRDALIEHSKSFSWRKCAQRYLDVYLRLAR